jgi:serine/threonine protein kinase
VDLPARIGRYEVELLLGEGGTGRVLLARDPVLRRQVAIKVVRDDLGLTPEQRRELTERILQEARAASTLSHPAMVALHDMGDDERVGLYLVFELVRGPTLRERLHDAGPLPAEEVARIALALGQALTHAHAEGLVHRGVKPENIMLAPTGPRLADFGLCQGDPRSPAYSAPEALTSGSFAARTDQFALGATLYEALTGRRAFPGDDPSAVAMMIRSGRHSAPRTALPALRGLLGLDAIFARALASDPVKRFPSCDAFAAALAGALHGPRVTFLATPGPVRSSIARATRRWQNGVALVAVVVILALVLIGRLRQPAAGEGAALKNVGGTTDKAAASMHRVETTAQSPAHARPSPSIAPSASATSSPPAPTFSSAGRSPSRNEGANDRPGGPHGDP